jgi:hypothetical protein
MQTTRSLFGPLLLIAAGAMWLLVQSGNVPASNLWALASIWPFLLIVAGLGLILRSYWSYTYLAVDIFIIGGVFLAVLFAPRMGWDTPPLGYTFGDNQFYVGPTERGSGTMKTETRQVSDFRAVEISYPAEVVISQGTSESLKIEADDNVLPGLQTRVQNNTLEIFYKSKDKVVRPTKPVKITIVVKDLNQVNFESAGKLEIQSLDTDSLGVSVSGAGDLKLNKITAKDLSVNLSGAGSMAATGTADNLDMNISGFGSFNGKELQTQTATISLSGAGSATARVAEKLDAEISGAGSINYYGSPDVTKQVSGVGGVTRSGD